jgi:Rhodopirellula transposase DDE domain
MQQRIGELESHQKKGHAQSPLRWTSKSTRHLAATLTRSGHAVSHETAAQSEATIGATFQAVARLFTRSRVPARETDPPLTRRGFSG